ncbi:MAG: hypothetical protein HYV63_31685, partial [Candidatus Schekmanbacteria bacterium]|nr:hypothetical protein [Candidatus Schekmanbacteria bacterium]
EIQRDVQLIRNAGEDGTGYLVPIASVAHIAGSTANDVLLATGLYAVGKQLAELGLKGLAELGVELLADETGAMIVPGAGRVAAGGAGEMAGAVAPRTFTSTDPIVADLANKIESVYPGHVVGVNVPITDATGMLVTDADILLRNAAIQVKSGSGAGLTRQVLVTESATGLPTIGYGPRLGGSVLRGIQQSGGLVTRDEKLLIEVVRP